MLATLFDQAYATREGWEPPGCHTILATAMILSFDKDHRLSRSALFAVFLRSSYSAKPGGTKVSASPLPDLRSQVSLHLYHIQSFAQLLVLMIQFRTIGSIPRNDCSHIYSGLSAVPRCYA